MDMKNRKNSLDGAIKMYKSIVSLEDKLEASKEILNYLVNKLDIDDLEEYMSVTNKIENDNQKRHNDRMNYIKRQGFIPKKVLVD